MNATKWLSATIYVCVVQGEGVFPSSLPCGYHVQLFPITFSRLSGPYTCKRSWDVTGIKNPIFLIC